MSVRVTGGALALLAVAAVALSAVAAVALRVTRQEAATPSCGTSGAHTVCLEVPEGPLRGEVAVSASVTPAEGVERVVFNWGEADPPLLQDFSAPYEGTWPTHKQLDGTAQLTVRVVTAAGAGEPFGRQVTLANGNASAVSRNPPDWADRFTPQVRAGEPVVAAVGDGASGESRSAQVRDAVVAARPTAFFYLGDVYERGTHAELQTYYGRPAFDGAAGSEWGVMAPYTVPVLGNHEAFSTDAWRDYWHQRPLFTSFDLAGVHYLALDSECARPGHGCDAASEQYAFVQRDLAANTLPCVVALWHRPVLGVSENAPLMEPLWALVAAGGGDLVLSAHSHDMEAYAPLNGALEAGEPDSHLVQLVSGAGGHHLIGQTGTDPRLDWQALKVPGALYVTHAGGATGPATRLDWAFRDTAGQVVDGRDARPGAGTVACA